MGCYLLPRTLQRILMRHEDACDDGQRVAAQAVPAAAGCIEAVATLGVSVVQHNASGVAKGPRTAVRG